MSKENIDWFIQEAINKGRILVDPVNGLVYKKRSTSSNKPVSPYISAVKNRNGYKAISVSIDGIQKSLSVHRIVWVFMNGVQPSGMVINHKNFNRFDNRIENLELVTPRGNVHHTSIHGRARDKGSLNPNAKLSDAVVLSIKKEYSPRRITIKMLADKYHMSKSAVGKILCGFSWKHLQAVK